MATFAATHVKTQLHPGALTIEWDAVASESSGDWQLLGHYQRKTLHAYGVWNGAVLIIEGSNESVPSEGNAIPLTETLQNQPIALTANAIREILENPLYFRPRIAGGDGSTSITVRVVCRPS